jgi:hypothetical protein
MSYPDEFLRGIPNSDFIGEDGFPTSDLFHFKPRDHTVREDNFIEESINWKDDEGAIIQLLDQRKDDNSIQFKGGIAVLSRNHLDQIISSPSVRGQLSYERREILNNKYHGNLLLQKDVSKRVMNRIAASIATLCVLETKRRPEE